MKIGSTKCPTIKIVEDDKVFICVAPPGTGGTQDVIVSIAAIPVTKQRQFIYEAPIITGIIPNQISSESSQLVTIVGRHFGAKDMTPRVFIEGDKSKVLFLCASNEWTSDSTIQCLTPGVSEAAEERNTVQVVVDGIRNSLLVDITPYFKYTDLPTFYSQCLRQANEECFDCVVSSCYNLETVKAISAGKVGADALDLCEEVAGQFCKFDRPV